MSRSAARPKSDRTVTAVRFPEEMYARLRQAAEERDLSMNYLVVKAMEEFLERLIPADELRLTRPHVSRMAVPDVRSS